MYNTNVYVSEIADKIISARDIERYCPDKWKKKTKPKNDKLSFSKPIEKPQQKTQQQIAATQEGNSVIVNEPSSNTNASSDDVNQLHEQSKQNGITIDKSASYNESSTIDDFPPSGTSYERTGQECSSCLELQDKVIELSE